MTFEKEGSINTVNLPCMRDGYTQRTESNPVEPASKLLCHCVLLSASVELKK